MKNSDVYDKFTEFINSEKYKMYFMSNEDEWNEKLKEVKKYIDENNKRPLQKEKIGMWIGTQTKKYKSMSKSYVNSFNGILQKKYK